MRVQPWECLGEYSSGQREDGCSYHWAIASTLATPTARVRCLVECESSKSGYKKCPMGSNSGEGEADWMGGSRFKMTYGAKWFDWCQETPAIVSPGTLSTVWLPSREAYFHPSVPLLQNHMFSAAPSQLLNLFSGVCRVWGAVSYSYLGSAADLGLSDSDGRWEKNLWEG